MSDRHAPWEAYGSSMAGCQVFDARGHIVAWAKNEETAKFIADAPEMFRLLKALAEDPEIRSLSPDECDEAIALIKKARGEG